MFLLIGDHNPGVISLGLELKERAHNVVNIDSESFSNEMRYNLDITSNSNDIKLVINGIEYTSDEISGVFIQPIHLWSGDLPEDEKDRDYTIAEKHSALLAFINSFNGRIINRYNSNLWFQTTPYYYDSSPLFSSVGIRVPEMIVTGDYDNLVSFLENKEYDVVYYPNSERIYYRIDSPEEGSKLRDLLKYFPVRLVELLEGDVFRFILIDDNSFTFKKDGDPSDDYEEVSASITEIRDKLGLVMCGFSLLKTPSGEWYGIDIKPYPNWSDCPDDLNRQITIKVADYLEGI